ncbi:MAG TPA: hypothetical protein EYP53_07600 [Candidatus Latescibacteria bacterium]|nr:hypothetical protein [Candidatus Latescibacterota bacterium]
MGETALGLSYGFLSMLLFGLYMVPRKLSDASPHSHLLSMCVGVLVTTISLKLVLDRSWTAGSAEIALSYVCGLLWALGTFCFIASVRWMGLSRATPVKNTTAVLGTGIGMLFFDEYKTTDPLTATAGSILIAGTAVLLARTSYNTGDNHSSSTSLGVIFGLLAAGSYASYTIPFKMVMLRGVSLEELIVFMGQGCLLGVLILSLPQRRRISEWLRETSRNQILGLLGGIIWALAVTALARSIKMVGVAVAWPLSNLNTVVAVAVGIVFFKEINYPVHKKEILLGMATATAGSVLLGLSR